MKDHEMINVIEDSERPSITFQNENQKMISLTYTIPDMKASALVSPSYCWNLVIVEAMKLGYTKVIQSTVTFFPVDLAKKTMSKMKRLKK